RCDSSRRTLRRFRRSEWRRRAEVAPRSPTRVPGWAMSLARSPASRPDQSPSPSCRSGIGDHVEQGRPHVRERRLLRQGIRVDCEDVSVRQTEANRMIPVASQFVFPLLGTVVEFNDQSDLRRLLALEVRSRPRVSAGAGGAIVNGTWAVRIETVTDHWLED